MFKHKWTSNMIVTTQTKADVTAQQYVWGLRLLQVSKCQNDPVRANKTSFQTRKYMLMIKRQNCLYCDDLMDSDTNGVVRKTIFCCGLHHLQNLPSPIISKARNRAQFHLYLPSPCFQCTALSTNLVSSFCDKLSSGSVGSS